LYSYEQMTDFKKIIGTSKEPRVGIIMTLWKPCSYKCCLNI
jgi:hypothetical protein